MVTQGQQTSKISEHWQLADKIANKVFENRSGAHAEKKNGTGHIILSLTEGEIKV